MDTNTEMNGETFQLPEPEPSADSKTLQGQHQTPGTPLHDAIDYLGLLSDHPAVYSNFFLSMFTPEGIRITFGESFGTDGTNAVARHCIFINLDTAMKLHATLAQSIQAIMNAKQQQMQATIAMMMGQPATGQPSTLPVPPNAG